MYTIILLFAPLGTTQERRPVWKLKKLATHILGQGEHVGLRGGVILHCCVFAKMGEAGPFVVYAEAC